MRRFVFGVAVAMIGTGCITVSSVTPGSASDKGVWISKGRAFGPLQLSDPEILYCEAGKAPMCVAAKQISALSGVSVENMNK